MIAVAALDEARGIGRDGQLLRPLHADLRHFKKLTQGKILIYGHKTLLTFPGNKPLPGRENWILSHSLAFDAVPGARIFPSMEAVLAEMQQRMEEGASADDFAVIGGASVFRTFFPQTTDLYLTQIHALYPADTHFPDYHDFVLQEESPLQEEDGVNFHYQHWQRLHQTLGGGLL